jgi:hypothetical protein
MEIRFPWQPDPASVPAQTPSLPPAPAPRRRGRPRRLASERSSGPSPEGGTAAPKPDWLYHHLTISGPAAAVADFAAAARGAGVIPWQVDFARIEEDVFNLAASQPAAERRLPIAGCRVLARQFRQRVEAHHAKANSRIDISRACPLDLHTLLPIPPAVLGLGASDPAALAWLAEHWGTIDRLHQVHERAKPRPGRRLRAGHSVIGYAFFTRADSPDAAMMRLGARWPTLRFVLQRRSLD